MERMEHLTEESEAGICLILRVELALFALEVEDETAAKHHTEKAWALNPRSWERYILCTLQGLFASCDRIPESIQWLEDSISACFEDEVILVECGLRPPNLSLARKLFSVGQRIPVIDYLLACSDVWRAKGMPFADWVQQIESGQRPDFEASEMIRELSRPFHRLDLQSDRIYRPQVARESSPPTKSRAQVLLARNRRIEESKKLLERINRERS